MYLRSPVKFVPGKILSHYIKSWYNVFLPLPLAKIHYSLTPWILNGWKISWFMSDRNKYILLLLYWINNPYWLNNNDVTIKNGFRTSWVQYVFQASSTCSCFNVTKSFNTSVTHTHTHTHTHTCMWILIPSRGTSKFNIKRQLANKKWIRRQNIFSHLKLLRGWVGYRFSSLNLSCE